MTDDLTTKVIHIVQDTLRSESGRADLVVTAEDGMETISDWDSMNFMKVFLNINEAFEINTDFDDAIHYTSISTLTDFLRTEITQ